MSLHEERILPRGVLKVHAEMSSPTNATWGKNEAAVAIAALNTPEYLRTLLKREVLYRQAVEHKGVSQVVVPKSPYGYGSVMVLAGDYRLFDQASDAELVTAEGVVPTKTIFDFDPELQKEYFRQILATMHAMDQFSLPGEQKHQGMPSVIATENSIYTVSNFIHRTSRSIALPHAHVFRASGWIATDEEPELPEGLRLEQMITRPSRYLGDFVQKLSSRMSEELGDLGEHIHVLQRGVEPYGHAITTPIRASWSLDEQAGALTRIMASHQVAYAELAHSKVAHAKLKDRSRARIIPQPSMRSYLYFDQGGFLTGVVSPVVVSGAGVLEAAGVHVHRDPAHENPYKNNEIERFREKVVSDMTRRLNGIV
jgi:hypothetical protein